MISKKIFEKVSVFFQGLLHDKLSLIALIIVCFFAVISLLSHFYIEPPREVNLEESYQSPSLKHPIGTDYLGRDMLAQLLLGSTDIFIYGSIMAVLVILIGTLVGTVAGYMGGSIDGALMTLTDTIMLIPRLPIILILALILGSFSPLVVVVVGGLTLWMWVARGVRTRVKQVKEIEFIEAVKCLGASRTHILFKEIVPHFAPYITIEFIRAIKNSIFILVGLMFLGFAPWSPYNWGTILYRASFEVGSIFIPQGIWHWGGVVLFIFLLTWALIQFSRYLEEVYSPRLKEYE